MDGIYRRKEQIEDSFDSKVDLRKQLEAGERIATTITEYAPYGYENYGESQTALVARTWNKKFISNFKMKQFCLGPTFAFAVSDRLILPNGVADIAETHALRDSIYSDCNPSGALWVAAYGDKGHAIHDIPDFEGCPTHLENWDRDGFFSDSENHPAKGLIILHRSLSETMSLGLTNPNADQNDDDGWTDTDTKEVLDKLCDFTNDKQNTKGHLVDDIRQKTFSPPSPTTKWDKI